VCALADEPGISSKINGCSENGRSRGARMKHHFDHSFEHLRQAKNSIQTFLVRPLWARFRLVACVGYLVDISHVDRTAWLGM
jgi:hypothetical protein